MLSLHLLPHDLFLGQRFCLSSVFVARRLIGKWLNELVSKNFNVCSAIALESVGSLSSLLSDGCLYPSVAIVGAFIFFGDDYGRVGIASENSFVPHEVVVDEFAG